MTAYLATATCTPSDPMLGTQTVSLVAFFLVGLLGGAHCIGMCGPLVALYSDRMNVSSRRPDTLSLEEVKQHALFNVGRTASYTAMGAVFGLAGSVVFVTARDITTVASDARSVAGIAVGFFVIAVGLGYVSSGTAPARTVVPNGWSAKLSSVVHRHLTPRIDGWVGDKRIMGLGAAHAFLPCPLLYPAFLYAFVQGSPTSGALSLAVLGAGTVPTVFLTGTVLGSTDVRGRRRLHRVLGVAFVVLGYIPLQHGLASFGVPLPHPPIPYYQPF